MLFRKHANIFLLCFQRYEMMNSFFILASVVCVLYGKFFTIPICMEKSRSSWDCFSWFMKWNLLVIIPSQRLKLIKNTKANFIMCLYPPFHSVSLYMNYLRCHFDIEVFVNVALSDSLNLFVLRPLPLHFLGSGIE